MPALDSPLQRPYVRIGFALAGVKPLDALPTAFQPDTFLTPRVWSLISLALMVEIGAGACHPQSAAVSPERCGPTVPETAQHPVAIPARELAGDYDLIQVRTQPAPGASSSGRLHLTPVDSAARAGAEGGAVRDLIGWFDPASADPHRLADAGSRDPTQPGAVLAGSHLRLGQSGSLESYVEHLTITAVSAEGFWGWWKAEPGFEVTQDQRSGRTLPDPAGYFCALRVRP
jgi:hypothetical protein